MIWLSSLLVPGRANFEPYGISPIGLSFKRREQEAEYQAFILKVTIAYIRFSLIFGGVALASAGALDPFVYDTPGSLTYALLIRFLVVVPPPLLLLLATFRERYRIEAHIAAMTAVCLVGIGFFSIAVKSNTLTLVYTFPAIAMVTTGALTAMDAVIRQSLGAMGKAMKTFVFDAGAVHSCEKGGLSVLFAGETYTWETPFPGCTNAVTTDRLTPVAATAPAAPAAPKTIDSSLTVAADKTIQLAFLYSINPDCTSIGFATVRIVEQPKHGKITIENDTGFTSFPTSNPRAECNKRRSDGVTVIYQPEPGYTGTDSLDFDAVLASGTVNRRHYTIDVR